MHDKGTVRLVDMENASQKFHQIIITIQDREDGAEESVYLSPHLTGYAIDEGWMDCGLFSERNIQHYVERAKEERQQLQ